MQRFPGPYYVPGRTWEVPVAFVNDGPTPIRTPFDMKADWMAAVQRGRLVPEFLSRPFGSLALWIGQRMQQPWRFEGGKALAPGARSSRAWVVLRAEPLTQALRIGFDVGGTTLARRMRSSRTAPVADTSPLSLPIARFVAEAQLPKLRGRSAIFRDSRHGITIFSVTFGEAHDCPAGCVYDSRTGIAVGERVGWLWHEESSATPTRAADVFRLRPDEDYLLSHAFYAALKTGLGGWHEAVRSGVIAHLLTHPRVSRRILVDLVESLYRTPDQWLARRLVQAPALANDAGLLTLLATLPVSAYETTGEAARTRLVAIADQVIADSTASPRTLFVLAQALDLSHDEALVLRLAAHPRARDDIAILTVLAEHHPALRPRLDARLRLSPRVRAMLDAYRQRGAFDGGRPGPGDALVADKEAGRNVELLLHLANLGSWNQEVAWMASRRLPETALLRWEPPLVPIR